MGPKYGQISLIFSKSLAPELRANAFPLPIHSVVRCGAPVQEAVVDMFVRVSVGVHEETATQQYKLCEVHNHHHHRHSHSSRCFLNESADLI